MTVGELLATLLAGVTFVVLIFALGFWLGRQQCEARATTMQRPHTWGVWTGCMIQAKDGQWVPINNYRVIE